MKMMFGVLIGSLVAVSAGASTNPAATTFTVNYPTVAATDSASLYTLTLAEGKASFALNDRSSILSFTCGPANQSNTSLFAVSLNGVVTLMGRKKDCRNSVEAIARTPAKFAMRITLTPDPESHASPGSEYQIQAAGQ